MVSLMRAATLFAGLTALVVAVLTPSVTGTPFQDDPYTLADGTTVDPTSSATQQTASDASANIYTTLSHNGPMGGMGRQLRQ